MLHSSFASANPQFLLKKISDSSSLPEEWNWPEEELAQRIGQACFHYSPYLTHLIHSFPDIIQDFFNLGPDKAWHSLSSKFTASSETELMQQMRRYKHKVALIIALADLSEMWNLHQVTAALSEVAENTLNASFDYLLKLYQQKNGLLINEPENGSGMIVLAMGKLGAHELNYSSDVDLILLYEPEKISHARGRPLPRLLNRFAQDFIRLMQDRTADGYVFRMDLRLRPDPASTPLMVSVDSAMRYYESVGQNWERAAYIKARPVAGDIKAGERFLKELTPFIWRKSLDYAALADIQSIKRQMDRQYDNLEITIPGYDVKRGLGGIREIEFLAQIHQLIWGGRQPELRCKKTLEVYPLLEKQGLLEANEIETLRENYKEFRRIEHRIQMLQDEQTHKLPANEEKLEDFSKFAGLESLVNLTKHIAEKATETHQIYHNAFSEQQSLAGDGVLVFTGVSHSPETLETLKKMGFRESKIISQTIQSWHRGSIAAMRSARARQLLTELTPSLLKEISKQSPPDEVFQRFATFFSQLPLGVTFLSLLSHEPQLFKTLISIIGNAPQLAKYLAKHPDWLDALLSLSDASKALTPEKILPVQNFKHMSHQPDEISRWLCRYRCEHEFTIGCQLLAGQASPDDVAPVLNSLADSALKTLFREVIHSFEEQYGTIRGSNFALVALGKLASKEMTFGSDIDLLFLYDCQDEMAESDGERSLGVSAYFNRLAQRIIGQLTAATPEGKLYEVDSRLRPAGVDGPLAVNLRALKQYYAADAWTFEKLALSRYRLITTNPENEEARYIPIIEECLQIDRDETQIKQDIIDMRRRIWKELPAKEEWNLKYSKGGMIDIAFIAQMLGLLHPEIRTPHPVASFQKAQEAGIAKTDELQAAYLFQSQLQTFLRLCHQDLREEGFSGGLKKRMATALGLKDFHEVRQQLQHHQQTSYNHFIEIIGDYS
jgi:glutamate-ammonia-ligase adenylyltransferase